MRSWSEEHSPLLKKKNAERKSLRKLLAFSGTGITLILISVIVWLSHQSTSASTDSAKSRIITGKQGAVAVELKECSDAGLDILKKGGNAVDSAIASALCIGVVNSFATGIGGGGFMLIRLPNGTYEFIDFRETAPAKSHKNMFDSDPMSAQRGGLSVAVPGEIRGFELAHKRHGKIPWADLFSSAIRVAEEGFKVTDLLYGKLLSSKKWIESSAGFSEVYAPTGVIARSGDIIKRPALGRSLRKIATQGPSIFYEGILAQTMVNATQAAGGILTMEDMRDYKPLIRSTISTTYHGKKVITCSAPTSGPILLSVLNMIEPYNLSKEGPTDLNIHRVIESLKFGYAFRTEVGDPEFLYNEERMKEIISKEWSDIVRKNISDDKTHEPLYYGPKYELNDPHGTMHLSVVDKDGGAVSLTSTVNLSFGAKFMDPISGIIMNDEMDDFSIPGVPNNFGLYPSIYNYAEPGKRPLSTITPAIVENEDSTLDLVVGGSGGSQILTATLNVILNTYDFGVDLFEAVKAPRIHHQLFPNIVGYETGYDEKILNALKRKGHLLQNLIEVDTVSASQAIRRLENGLLHAVSDPRKGGVAAAY